MNTTQLLKIDIERIAKTILDYSRDANVREYLSQMVTACESGNFGAVEQWLTEVDRWYEKEMGIIQCTNDIGLYVQHRENQKFIQQTIMAINTKDIHTQKALASSQEEPPVIFLSHKSDDKKYGNAIRKFLIGLGVKDNQLIYTSHPRNAIPLGVNIFDYLRDHISHKNYMIFLWSDKYLESPACMNEMGAAWVVRADYTNVYVPTFNFNNPKYSQCALDTRKKGIVLDGGSECKAQMLRLKDKILSLFNLENDELKNIALLDEFLHDLNVID